MLQSERYYKWDVERVETVSRWSSELIPLMFLFATSKSRSKYPYDAIESKMVDIQVFEFSYQIPPSQQKDLTPCPKYFGDLVLLEEMWAFHSFISFVRFYFVFIYLTYSQLKQAVLAHTFTSSSIK